MNTNPRELKSLTTKDGKVPFDEWFDSLRDAKAVAAILRRLDRAENGNLGDVAPVGDGVSEMRIDYGPGYRVYFVDLGSKIVILIGGGTKKSQSSDITKATDLWKEYENDIKSNTGDAGQETA